MLISTGGGVIPPASIYQPTGAEVDFCLQTYDKPGPTRCRSSTPTAGTSRPRSPRCPNLTGAAGWTPAAPTLTLSGGGIEPGATFTATGASWSSATNLVAGQSITAGNTTDDSVHFNNFVGPSNGGTATITMTNPDLTTATWTITAPKRHR